MNQRSVKTTSKRWWDLITKKSKGKKWKTLKQNGPKFPPEYIPIPKGVRIKVKGKYRDLDSRSVNNRFGVSAEEAAMFYAKNLEVNDRGIREKKKQVKDDIRKDKVFNKNFLDDWKEILGKSGKDIKSLADVDFGELVSYTVQESDRKKKEKASQTKTEKELLKKEKSAEKEVYGYASFDGVLIPCAYGIEPPGVFKGHGFSKNRGKIKPRVSPRDITLNASSAPVCFQNGKKCAWGQVIADKNATWLARWQHPITGKATYLDLKRASNPWVGKSDYDKFEKARKLDDKIQLIRKKYKKDFRDSSKRKLAAAVYLLDEIAIRPGAEAGETKGLTTLKCDNLKWHARNEVTISFVGKSSIAFSKRIKINPTVYKILKDHCQKNPSGALFPKINQRVLNKYLSSLSKGLTAKVFRTWKASSEVANALSMANPKSDTPVNEKKDSYDRAILKAALALNHKRLTENSEKVDKIKAKISQLESELSGLTGSKLTRKKTAILSQKTKLKTAEENVALNTSKQNYVDPRVTVAWGKKHDMPISKLMNATMRDKFIWAMETPSAWQFAKAKRSRKSKFQ